jgi:threonine dehydratase
LASRLSLAAIEAACRVIDPVFLHTPQFLSEPIGDELGLSLVVKVETVNPIRSFKGRGADFFLASAGGSPADSPALVCASAGNFGQGLAYAARARGFRLVVFAAENANPLKVDRMRRFGADVRLHGLDFDVAKARAREYAEQTGGRFVDDGREQEIAEGAGTIAVELCGWRDSFDALLVPLGNGALLSGIGRWMKAHAPATRVIGIAAVGAPAMAESIRAAEARSTASVDTIADGIAVRVPVREALADLDGVVDEVRLVDDEMLVTAMRLVWRHHGLVVEPAGVAGLAAACAFRQSLAGKRVAVPLCGGNVTAEQIGRWLQA